MIPRRKIKLVLRFVQRFVLKIHLNLAFYVLGALLLVVLISLESVFRSFMLLQFHLQSLKRTSS